MRAFHCQCGKMFSWTPEKAGKHAQCPGCDQTITIPQLPDTFEHDPQPANASQTIHCPACKTPLQPKAVICLECGYDLRTGKQLTTKIQPAEKNNAADQDDQLDQLEQEIDQEDSGEGMWILKAAGFFSTLTMVIIWKLTGISFFTAVIIGVFAIPIMSIIYLLIFGLIARAFSFLIPGSKKNDNQ